MRLSLRAPRRVPQRHRRWVPTYVAPATPAPAGGGSSVHRPPYRYQPAQSVPKRINGQTRIVCLVAVPNRGRYQHTDRTHRNLSVESRSRDPHHCFRARTNIYCRAAAPAYDDRRIIGPGAHRWKTERDQIARTVALAYIAARHHASH